MHAAAMYRLPQFSRMQQLVDLGMRLVVDTHKANLHQTPPGVKLGAQDTLSVRNGCRHRFLAEDGFARFDTGDGQVGMRGVRAGDQHSVYAGIGDQFGGIGQGACATVRRNRLGARPIDIHDSCHGRASRPPRQIVRVHGADHARADDADLYLVIVHCGLPIALPRPAVCAECIVFGRRRNEIGRTACRKTDS